MSTVRRAALTITLVCILATGVLAFVKREIILDTLVLRGYTTPADIQKLATDTTMTPLSQRLFFVNKPVVEGKESFNQHCTNTTDQVATLGCYTGNRNGIYVYDVTDERLHGVEEVTAAHEMLHQAYDRLSGNERERVNGLLKQYYSSLTDEIMLGQMDTYKKTEPSQLANEMHSLFGTQARNLPPELEEYYKQYFADRQKVVDYYELYRSEFDQRRKQILAYDTELDSLKQQIEDHKASLKAREGQLSTQRAQLNRYMAADQIVEYNAAVPGFNSLVNAYRAEVGETNAVINRFNEVLDARNTIAVQEQELQKALDSQIEQAP